MQTPQLIPVLSLLVAFLAVIMSPFVSLAISKRQVRVAHRQMLGPMRQAWINELRRKVSVLMGDATFYAAAAAHPSENTETAYRVLSEIQQEIELMINPSETDHQDLVSSIGAMMRAMNKVISGKAPFDEFKTEQRKVVALAQKIFKTEWDRVKVEG